jgi:hypothetical protein
MPTHPYIGLSAERVLELANTKNSKSYQLGVDFNWGTVESAVAPGGRNSRVRLLSLLPDYQSDWLYFRRLSPTDIDKQPEGDIQLVEMPDLPTSTHAILPLLNEALGLNLVPEEVEDLTYTDIQETYPLTIKEGSYAWTPGTYQFKTELKFPLDLRLVSEDGTTYRAIDEEGTYRIRGSE